MKEHQGPCSFSQGSVSLTISDRHIEMSASLTDSLLSYHMSTGAPYFSFAANISGAI